jgi:flagellar protein FlaG
MDAHINDISTNRLLGSAFPQDLKPAAGESVKQSGVPFEDAAVSDRENAVAVDRGTLEAAAEKVQSQLENEGISLTFKITEESGDLQVEMINTESKKVIRKMPSDELLKLSTSMKKLAGGFLNRAV